MEYKTIAGSVCAAKGFTAGGVHCGIRKNRDKKDLAVILSEVPCTAAAVYTQNKVKGAPIAVTKKNIANGIARAVICNSGNANTCNADGEEKALATCDALAKALGIAPEDVIIASTGVIGQPILLEPILAGIDLLAGNLTKEGDHDAALAIMTTDTKPKEHAVEFTLGGKTCRMGGIAKGSGMIHPNMATMLCFLTTDAAVSAEILSKALTEAVTDTFNMISIDGDTSTNDMVSVMASGLCGNEPLTSADTPEYTAFAGALKILCAQIAKELAADGEGATKLLECNVTGAPDKTVARIVSKQVITSSLFKAAMFGEDANWGRILCAIGYAPAEFDITKVAVFLGSKAGKIQVCANGAGVPFSEEEAKVVLSEKEIVIDVDLGSGDGAATAWGCDLTYDYVKINGDYRT
ncbi:MAG: bifunctional glutamate N-acetyltransferase/amino-acid acetyltransferase ArgJ [Ruminococcaceae bacterium]|nr:bifunctional glutamate N-acetyltransferase/amino-acid acetyltransferase ArgJ [Oscillospiraceae bacterium]